jgi:SAM-dependent methyltransferase
MMFSTLQPGLRALMPRSVRRAARAALDRLAILADRIGSRTHDLTPPQTLIHGIGSSWETGEHYLRHFRELCDLQPHETVLDIGCGVGRMAVPLTRFLGALGRYEGFDIIPANVRWCRRAITPRWPRFRFQHADIFNREYNPDGRLKGHEFRFPYPDATFDFAFLTSVFTHLMPAETAHYLHELQRVLKPGGRCLATFNLLNDEANLLIDAGKCRHMLQPRDGLIRVHSHEVPEACVAIDEGFVIASAGEAGLVVDPPIRYGSWCGRDAGFDFQDIVILRRPLAV